MTRTALFAVAVLAAACAAPVARELARPAGFVNAASVVSGLGVDMRYAGSRNFVGRPIAGYEVALCLLTSEAAAALAGVQRDLAASGRGLKV